MMRFVVGSLALLAAAPAFAGTCSIHNDTDESFTIESGNISNQRVGAHTQTTIESGTVIAKSDTGKAVGGSCQDGQHVEIVLDQGVLVMRPEK